MKSSRGKIDFIVGIDEAGRGPLAGPLYIGGVLLRRNDSLHKEKIKDSKHLAHEKREEWYRFLRKERKAGRLSYVAVSVSSSQIDSRGLSNPTSRAISRLLNKLKANPAKTLVLLDGGLKGPDDFLFRETIIKGDEKYPVIALASIVAKVLRDRVMIRLAKKYPDYTFDVHKGYGTKLHRTEIIRHGPSAVHRRRFLGNIVKWQGDKNPQPIS